MIDFREHKERPKLKRPCRQCGKYFTPTGWCSRKCDKCKNIIKRERYARTREKNKIKKEEKLKTK